MVTLQFMRRTASKGLLVDCQVVAINDGAGTGASSEGAGGKKGVAIVMGPRFMEKKYYQESPAEDLTLAKLLVRPGNQFLDDPVMKDEALLTAANYGSVKKVFVVAKADESSTEEMQRWMVEMSPGTEVEEIAGADHAVMNSKTKELCDVLGRVASRYD